MGGRRPKGDQTIRGVCGDSQDRGIGKSARIRQGLAREH